MKKSFITALLLGVMSLSALSQQLTQTVRGTIKDVDSHLPIIGANVIIAGTNPILGTATDVDGQFRLENIPIGRITLHVSYLGYEQQVIPNIEVNSGKEVVLDLKIQESIVKMEEVVVKAQQEQGKALNDMAAISSRSISAEKTERFAGGFSDPSRIVSAYAGVATTGDGDNDIIIRGNSPKYLQYRLEGVEITNPTHFGDQNAVRGGVSALNNNLLATSDFYTGAFPAEFGEALSGVYDLKLRTGNNEQREMTLGFGLLGTDFTIEGPFKKGYGGSYLVNYRYSTISIISDLGLVNIDGLFNFQDAAFKVLLPTSKAGTFSIFGLGGRSDFLLKDVKPDLFATPGDNPRSSDIREDYDKRNHLLNLGLNHTLLLDDHSFIKTTLAYSSTGIDEDVFEYNTLKITDNEGEIVKDSTFNQTLDYISRLKNSTLRGAIIYTNKINAKNKLKIGARYTLNRYNYQQSWLDLDTRFTAVDLEKNISLAHFFLSWKHRFNEKLSMVYGFQNTNVLFNNKSTFESRIGLNWQFNLTSSLNLGLGSHSKMESIHNYFARVKLEDGQIVEPNLDLDLLKAYHAVLSYEKRFNRNLRTTVEIYYQHLYNLPVENDVNSPYATINEGNEFRYVDLVNEGTGKNYGIELTIERFFDNDYYFLFNGSLFHSTYKALDGIERNTQYNGRYLVNLLAGKEFNNLGRKKNKTLSLNAKIFLGGGKPNLSLLRDSEGNLAVDPSNDRYYDFSRAYEDKLDDIYTIILSARYKINLHRTTHEIFLNLDNITNTKGKLTEYYDADAPNSTGYISQFGFFPNLMYRLYF